MEQAHKHRNKDTHVELEVRSRASWKLVQKWVETPSRRREELYKEIK
jgi:hypothetical protein